MKRWHQDVKKMKKQEKTWKMANHRSGNGFDKELGKFRKRHALDCGKTDCCICHYSKIYGVKTYKQQVADLQKKEQINEACNAG